MEKNTTGSLCLVTWFGTLKSKWHHALVSGQQSGFCNDVTKEGGRVQTGNRLRLSLIHDEGTYPGCFAPVFKVLGYGGFWSIMGKSVMFVSPLPQCQSEVQQPGGISLTSRLKVIGPRCWQEAELLHCGCFNLNIQLSNTSLHRPQVTSSVHLYIIQVPVWCHGVWVPVWRCCVSGWGSSGCRHRGRPAVLMFRCKRQYTESRSVVPAGCKLPVAAAPEHDTPGISLMPFFSKMAKEDLCSLNFDEFKYPKYHTMAEKDLI